MRASGFKPQRPFGLAWLFWLALLLPMAQSAAAWHGYAHASRSAAAHDADKHAPNAAHCDLCLAAAAVGGGAWVAAQPGPALLSMGHQRPQPAVTGAWHARTTPAYLSRAPPTAPR